MRGNQSCKSPLPYRIPRHPSRTSFMFIVLCKRNHRSRPSPPFYRPIPPPPPPLSLLHIISPSSEFPNRNHSYQSPDPLGLAIQFHPIQIDLIQENIQPAMVRISNGIVSVVNVITFVISLCVIGASIWFFVSHSTPCQRYIQKPLFLLGICLLIVSFFGLLGSIFDIRICLWIYLFLMFVMILVLMCTTVFVVVVTNKGVGKAISGKGFKEYRLGDYSNWLQNYVVNGENWGKFRSCLADYSGTCSGFDGDESLEAFNKRSLSPVQSGCCKPPTYCGFTYKNATFWDMPKTGPAVPDPDCTTWSNNQKNLCYDCKSCKAGVLANLKKDWRLLAVINVVILMFVIIIYSIGCCALRSSKSQWRRR